MKVDHKGRDEWKIQLIMKLIFFSFVDKNDTHEMYSKSGNIVIMSGSDANDLINEIFDSLVKRYQEGLETKIKGSSYTFERVHLLKYYLHKITLNRGSSNIKSTEWIKNKKATTNAKILKITNAFNMQ